jgi:hypothetical protein
MHVEKDCISTGFRTQYKAGLTLNHMQRGIHYSWIIKALSLRI